MKNRFVLGVDGGGTKTAALLAEITSAEDYRVLGRGRSNSSNVNAVGWEKAIANLDEAIKEASRSAQHELASVSVAVLALSGAGREDVKKKFADWTMKQQLAKQVKVIHDAEAVIHAGTPEGWGIALIAGTGSVAFGLSKSLETSVVGGWGYWFGDEGSAFWLGQSALRAVSMEADGRGPQTALSRSVLKQLRIKEPRKILSKLSADRGVRENIAGLAEIVVHQAEQGDPIAARIIKEGSLELAKLVQSTAEQVQLSSSFPLALAGGVLTHSELVRSGVAYELTKSGLTPSPIAVVEEPALGAIKLAAKILSHGV